MMATLTIALITYISMVIVAKKRMPIAVLGSSALLIYGTISGSFPADLAFERFPAEIVILIVVLALFTRVFEEHGFFQLVEHLFMRITRGKRILIIVLVPVIIYSTSLFMNNLSVILLFTFICLQLTLRFNLPVTPLLVSAIIASNIGGAPLPWADTPAVILTLYSDFNFIDFITKLFLPCAFYTALLAAYSIIWFKYLGDKTFFDEDIKIPDTPIIHYIIKPRPHEPLSHHLKDPEPGIKLLPHLHGPEPPRKEPPHLIKAHSSIDGYHGPRIPEKMPKNKNLRTQVLFFILFIVFICIGPFINISIAFISMLFGSIVLIINKYKPEEIVNSIPVLDSLVFIVALFLIGSALEYSGVLKIAVDYILTFTGESRYLILLSIMLSAFIIATFLSAGPAAATLLPVCTQLSALVGNRLVFAALALGILAGSSMLPWSATGGPVMLGEVNRFLKQSHLRTEEKEKIQKVFSLRHYLVFSIPFSLIMVALNALFLALYVVIF